MSWINLLKAGGKHLEGSVRDDYNDVLMSRGGLSGKSPALALQMPQVNVFAADGQLMSKSGVNVFNGEVPYKITPCHGVNCFPTALSNYTGLRYDNVVHYLEADAFEDSPETYLASLNSIPSDVAFNFLTDNLGMKYTPLVGSVGEKSSQLSQVDHGLLLMKLPEIDFMNDHIEAVIGGLPVRQLHHASADARVADYEGVFTKPGGQILGDGSRLSMHQTGPKLNKGSSPPGWPDPWYWLQEHLD